MKHLIFIIFLITRSISSFGQNSNENLTNINDSLKQKVKVMQNDSVKAETLLLIAENLIYTSPDSTIYYGEKALILAEKIKNVSIQIGAMGFIGNALINKGNFQKLWNLDSGQLK